MDIRSKKRIKRKKRKLSKADVKKRKNKIKSKKGKVIATARASAKRIVKRGLKSSPNIVINLNLAQPSPSLRKRRNKQPIRTNKFNKVTPIVNASQFRNQNTFFKPSINNGNTLLELPRLGGSTTPLTKIEGISANPMVQLQIDRENSRRINTVTGRNVYKEESDIRKIMQSSGNLAILSNVKNWIKEEGYKIEKNLKKKQVIDFIISSPELSQTFLNKDWKKKPVPLLRIEEPVPFTNEIEGYNTRSKSKLGNEINFS